MLLVEERIVGLQRGRTKVVVVVVVVAVVVVVVVAVAVVVDFIVADCFFLGRLGI